MKLPRFESNQDVVSLGNGQFYSTSASHTSMPGVEMNGIFDTIWDGIKGAVGKIPCVLSKAGGKGVSCLAQCGPNPACLATCAGPSVVSAIMDCI